MALLLQGGGSDIAPKIVHHNKDYFPGTKRSFYNSLL
jgi:hypothetical protein